MTPVSYALPPLLILCCWAIASRFHLSTHPALISYHLLIAARQAVVACGIAIPPACLAVDSAIGLWLLAEVCRYARAQVRPQWILAALLVAGAPWLLTSYAADERIYLGWWMLTAIRAAGFAAVTAYRAWRPIAECQRHRIVRVGMTLWIAVIAVAGSYVRGGPLWAILPHTGQVRSVLAWGSACGVAVIVPVMAWMMLSAAPRRNVVAIAMRRERWRAAA